MPYEARALARCFREQARLGAQLATLADDEAAAVTAGDLVSLTRIVEMKRSVCLTLATVESERAATAHSLAERVGLSPDEPLAGVCTRLPASERMLLQRLAGQLIGIHAGLERRHQRNRMLLENGLAFVQFSLSALMSAASRQAAAAGFDADQSTPSLIYDQRA